MMYRAQQNSHTYLIYLLEMCQDDVSKRTRDSCDNHVIYFRN